MTWQTTLLAALVVLWAAIQYGLALHALRDLNRRPRVRGNNKVVWALVILGIPIVGALVYTVYGPTSFIGRERPRTPPRPSERVELPNLTADDPSPGDPELTGPSQTARLPRGSRDRADSPRLLPPIPGLVDPPTDATRTPERFPPRTSTPSDRKRSSRR